MYTVKIKKLLKIFLDKILPIIKNLYDKISSFALVKITQLYAKLFEIELENIDIVDLYINQKIPIIFACKHSNILPIIMMFAKKRQEQFKKLAFITANTYEANVAKRILHNREFPIIERQSSSSDRIKPIRDSLRMTEKGYSIALTIDEKKKKQTRNQVDNTQREIKKGALWLASQSGSPLIPVTASSTFTIKLKTLDKLLIPIPYLRFSKLFIRFHKPYLLEKGIFPKNNLESHLNKLSYYLDQYERHSTSKVILHRKSIPNTIFKTIFLTSFLFLSLVCACNCFSGLIKTFFLIIITLCFYLYILINDKSSLRLVCSPDYCDYNSQNTMKILHDLVKMSYGNVPTGSNGVLLIVCGKFLPVFMEDEGKKLMKSLMHALSSGVIVKVIITDEDFQVDNFNTDQKKLLKNPYLRIYVKKEGYSISNHFIVANSLHVRLEYSHLTGAYPERYAETYYYCQKMGMRYSKYFDSLIKSNKVELLSLNY